MMETIRWIFGIVALGIFILVVFLNWIMLVSSMVTHRFHSQVPLVGALLGIGALALIPVTMPHYSIYFLPILLDCGTVMFLLALPSLIYDMMFASYAVKLEDGFLLFIRKNEILRKISVSDIFQCEKRNGKITVWCVIQSHHVVYDFGLKWENANEVYMVLKDLVAHKGREPIGGVNADR